MSPDTTQEHPAAQRYDVEQEREAQAAFWRSSRHKLVGIMQSPLNELVTSSDRHNLALVLLGVFDRVNYLENEMRRLEGKPLLDFGEARYESL